MLELTFFRPHASGRLEIFREDFLTFREVFSGVREDFQTSGRFVLAPGRIFKPPGSFFLASGMGLRKICSISDLKKFEEI